MKSGEETVILGLIFTNTGISQLSVIQSDICLKEEKILEWTEITVNYHTISWFLVRFKI